MRKRAHLLWLYYFSGPLFGFHQKLVVADNQPLPLWKPVIVTAVLTATIVSGWSRSSPLALALLLSVFVYALSPVVQIVLEYRAYLASAGIALLLASVFRDHPLALVPILVFFIRQTLHRHRLYTSPVHFWRQAAIDCPSPAVIANLAIALRNPDLMAEFGMTLDGNTLHHLEVVELPPVVPRDQTVELPQRELASDAVVVTEELFGNTPDGRVAGRSANGDRREGDQE